MRLTITFWNDSEEAINKPQYGGEETYHLSSGARIDSAGIHNCQNGRVIATETDQGWHSLASGRIYSDVSLTSN